MKPVLILLLLAGTLVTPLLADTSDTGETVEKTEAENEDEGGSSFVPIGGYNPVYKVFLGGGYFHRGPRHSFGIHGVGTFVNVYQVMLHWEQLAAPLIKYSTDIEYSRGYEPFYGEGGETKAADVVNIWGDKTLAKPRLTFVGVKDLELGAFADVRSRGEDRVDGRTGRLFPNETSLGVGIYLSYDKRNHKDNPTDGYLLDAEITHVPDSFTTLDNPAFSLFEGKFTTYQEMIAGVVAAMRFAGGITAGTPSYLFKYRLGGTDVMRGYYDNRFRGAKYYLQQTELRFPLPWIFEGAAFIGFGDASDGAFTAPKMAYGGGLRIGLPPDYVSKIRIDVGFGQDQSGIFVDFNQAF